MYRRFLHLVLAVPLLMTGVTIPCVHAQGTFADPGFIAETVVHLPPFTAVGLAFAPDGRMFIWEKSGVVRIVKNSELLATPFIDISSRVNQVLDRGLLGLAIDVNFSSNG